jgi:hypothetical protein
MVFGVGIAGLSLTTLIDGPDAARQLLQSSRQSTGQRRYYAALLSRPQRS